MSRLVDSSRCRHRRRSQVRQGVRVTQCDTCVCVCGGCGIDDGATREKSERVRSRGSGCSVVCDREAQHAAAAERDRKRDEPPTPPPPSPLLHHFLSLLPLLHMLPRTCTHARLTEDKAEEQLLQQQQQQQAAGGGAGQAAEL